MSESTNPYQTPFAAPLPAEIPEAEQLDLATRGERLGGAILDQLIIGGTAGVFYGFSSQLQQLMNLRFPDWLDNYIAIPIILIANIVPLATKGQTLGKMIVCTKIVTMGDRKPPLWKLLLLRYFPLWFNYLLPDGGSIFSLLDVLFIFRRDHRCLHDLLAGTKVVKIGRPLVPEVLPVRMSPSLNDRPLIIARMLQDKLHLKPSEVPLDAKWTDELRIPAGEYSRFCEDLADEIQGPSAEVLERCTTYRELLARLGVAPSAMRG